MGITVRDDAGDDDELPLGQGLYEDMVEAVAEMDPSQRMALVSYLQGGHEWADLPTWAQNLFVLLEAGGDPTEG